MTDIDTRTDCGACGRPQADHGVRYAAGLGDHTWLPDFESPMLDGIRARHSAPATVPHPDGGVTIAVDPSRPGGGDRLPARDVSEWIETTDPAPAEAPLPPVSESSYPPDAVDLPIQYSNIGLIRRILNAANRKG
jgi:hypothetical protein